MKPLLIINRIAMYLFLNFFLLSTHLFKQLKNKTKQRNH